MKRSHILWLMCRVSEEIIRNYLDIPASDKNISKLAKILIDFEHEVLTEAKQVSSYSS